MSGYELLKFVHVLAVIAWVGAAIGFTVLQARLGNAGDRAGLMSFGRQMETMGPQYYGSLTVLTLVTGIWMVATTEGIAFGDPWILIGLAGLVVTFAVGLGLITPTGKRLLEESERPAPDAAAIGALSARMRAFTLMNLIILVIVVWAMVTKPGL